jgi:hypothetical protein
VSTYPQTAGNRGLVVTRRSRATGLLVSVYRGAEAGIEDDPALPYVTVCEAHGSAVCHSSKRLAVSWLAEPQTWCEQCQREQR